jgi:hypothetical protein
VVKYSHWKDNTQERKQHRQNQRQIAKKTATPARGEIERRRTILLHKCDLVPLFFYRDLINVPLNALCAGQRKQNIKQPLPNSHFSQLL